MKTEKYKTIVNFEDDIKKYENLLFGIRLFMEGIKFLYGNDKNTIDIANYHFESIMKRGGKAILEAKEL